MGLALPEQYCRQAIRCYLIVSNYQVWVINSHCSFCIRYGSLAVRYPLVIVHYKLVIVN